MADRMTADEMKWRAEPVSSDEAAKLYGRSRDRFLRDVASQPGFPEPIGLRPLTWIRGEILDHRESHRPRRAA